MMFKKCWGRHTEEQRIIKYVITDFIYHKPLVLVSQAWRKYCRDCHNQQGLWWGIVVLERPYDRVSQKGVNGFIRSIRRTRVL